MPEKKEKSKGRFSYLHLILAIAVSTAVAIAHWTHLYDQLEFRLHDAFFKFRGEIEQFPQGRHYGYRRSSSSDPGRVAMDQG